MTAPLAPFRLHLPANVASAVAAYHEQPDSRYLGGGTDLLVNLRRGIKTASHLIDVTSIPELRELACRDGGVRIGASVSIAQLAGAPELRVRYPALSQAAAALAGPAHRNAATVGGNLCLDTRCIYYNQSDWWRNAIGFCLKYRGEVCHVAPQGRRCLASFSGDLAPSLLVLGAEIEVAGRAVRRHMPLAQLYQEDGRAHLTLAPGELIVAVTLPPDPPPSAYEKARLRGSVDFPLAGVAVALRLAAAELASMRVAVTGTNSCPILIEGTDALLGRPLDAAALLHLDKLVQKQVHPMRTTLAQANYRRLAAGALARRLAHGLASAARPAGSS